MRLRYDDLDIMLDLFPGLTYLGVGLLRNLRRLPVCALKLDALETLHMPNVGGEPIIPLDEVRSVCVWCPRGRRYLSRDRL